MAISTADLQARHEALVQALSLDGEATANILDASASPAAVDIRIRAPGGRAGHAASFRYFEKYARSGAGWMLVEYVYLISWQNGLGQLEYHWHPLPWSAEEPIFHIHCQPPGGARGYFRSHALLLEEARTDLLRRYGAWMAVDCSGLYPLDAT